MTASPSDADPGQAPTAAAAAAAKAREPMTYGPVRVAIAGGGISGLACALHLARQGYRVSVYEEKPWLGGNVSSYRDPKSGTLHDVYPHMFSNFYVNFWDIVEKELGMTRGSGPDDDFAPRDVFGLQSMAGGLRVLKNDATLDPVALLENMRSGAGGLGPLDMYLYMYSLLDLIEHRFEARGLLGLSLNDYLRARPCMTGEVAKAHDTLVMFIWSIHSGLTSAASYKSFYRQAFGNMQPLLWLLRGSLQDKLIAPLERRLVELGVAIHKGVRLEKVIIDDYRVSAIELRRARYDDQAHRAIVTRETVAADPFDQLVLALPPGALGRVVGEGREGQRIADRVPRLRHAGRRLPSEPIAVVDLYLNKKLANVPNENVSVVDSDCYFSYVDLSQLWPELQQENITALTLAVSDYWSLPSNSAHQNGHHMIRELAKYMPAFDPGDHWGDPNSDVDWVRTAYRSNEDDVIFVNQVGSWEYRPDVHVEEIRNLYFAGDFCRNHIDMATVEAAVTSGINAAAALQLQAPMGDTEIRCLDAPIWSHEAIGLLKMALAPAAYMAKAALTARDLVTDTLAGGSPRDLNADAVALMALPMRFVVDMTETAGEIATNLLGRAVGSPSPASSTHHLPLSTRAAPAPLQGPDGRRPKS